MSTRKPHPHDAMTAQERAEVEKLPAPARAKALLDQKRFELSRAERRAGLESLPKRRKSLLGEVTTAATDVALLAANPDVIDAAADDPQLAQMVASLQQRASTLVESVVTNPALALAPADPQKATLIAAGERISPEDFRRRVQVRRRKAALEAKGKKDKR